MTKKLNSLEDLKGAIDFSDYKPPKPKAPVYHSMEDLGFTKSNNRTLSNNQHTHRQKVYEEYIDDEDEIDEFDWEE